jgi:hypothetical protein
MVLQAKNAFRRSAYNCVIAKIPLVYAMESSLANIVPVDMQLDNLLFKTSKTDTVISNHFAAVAEFSK